MAEASWTKQSDSDLKVQVGVVVPRYNFEIMAPKDVSTSVARFEPNAETKSALGFSYRNIGGSLSVVNTPNEESKTNFGTTKSTDFQVRFFGKRTYEFFYQSYQGYFISNSVDLDSSYSGLRSRIQRPDIQTKNYGLNFFWNIDDEHFSQAVSFDQAGRQKDSAWGLSWLFHGSQSEITGDSAFVPPTAAPQFGSLASLNSVKRSTGAVGLGIGGILTAFDFYATAFVALGVGSQLIHIKGTALAETSSSITGTYASARLGIGYNGVRNVVGLQLLSDGVTSAIANGEIRGNTLAVNAFYAYRFQDIDLPVLNRISSWFD